jgi:DNA-binding FadR family transcriptional regulator
MPELKDLRIQTRSAADEVVLRFQELLFNGELKPGDKLPTEPELAQMFGVGRSTVREALRVLTYLGIFETLVAKGTYVRASTEIYKEAMTWSFLVQPKEIGYMLDHREAIEVHSIRQVAKRYRSNPGQIEDLVRRLAQLCDDMDRYAAASDYEQLDLADFQFHQAIVEASGNPYFISIFDLLSSGFFTYTREIAKMRFEQGSIKQQAEEHRLYFPAIRSGNVIVAQKAVFDHMQMVRGLLSRATVQIPVS